MKRNNIYHLGVPVLLGIAFAVLAWVRLVVLNGDLLYEAQAQSFWQAGALFRADTLALAGGWFTYVGLYLTQFFYYPALGASILILLWLCIYLLWLLAFRLKWYLSWIAMIVPMLLLWAETSFGYAVYSSKVPDWWFTPTLFALFISLLLAVVIPFNRWIRYSWQGVVILAALILANQWKTEAQVPDALWTPFHPMHVDTRFHAEMQMERAIEEGKWKEAMAILRSCKEAPTRSMGLMKTIALLHEGRLVDSWLDYPCITEQPNFNDSIGAPLAISSGPLVYFHHGSIQFAYRWSVENMVEFGVSNRRLRLMTQCALLKGEWDLAKKYLTMLSRTTFHKKWAEEHEQFLNHPNRLAEDSYYKIPLAISQARMNLLDGDESLVEKYLINTYAQTGINDCKELSELSLMYAMQSQVITHFWAQFYNYANLHPSSMPRVVQEAIYLFVQLEPQTAPRTNFPFSPTIAESFKNFNNRSTMLMKQGYKDKKLADALYREFGKTYYWFYFFCREQNTY